MYYFRLFNTYNFNALREDVMRMQNAFANTPKQYGMRTRKTNHGKR
jgi:hypothetical protein